MSKPYRESMKPATRIFRKKRGKWNPTESTIKKAQGFLPLLLKSMAACVQSQSQEILKAWDRLSEEKYCGMSKAVGYDNKSKTLQIKVFDSSFYATLSQCPQKQLIAYIKQAVPHADLKRVQFILG